MYPALEFGFFDVKWYFCRMRSQVCYRASDFGLGLKWRENCNFAGLKQGKGFVHLREKLLPLKFGTVSFRILVTSPLNTKLL